MRVDPTTLLFDDLDTGDSSRLKAIAEDIVLRGKMPPTSDRYVMAWCEAAGLDERQWILMMSVAFPQRVLLSLLRHAEETRE